MPANESLMTIPTVPQLPICSAKSVGCLIYLCSPPTLCEARYGSSSLQLDPRSWVEFRKCLTSLESPSASRFALGSSRTWLCCYKDYSIVRDTPQNRLLLSHGQPQESGGLSIISVMRSSNFESLSLKLRTSGTPWLLATMKLSRYESDYGRLMKLRKTSICMRYVPPLDH